MNENTVWLSSYPRSGNTLLRTILWHCFGLGSGSIYLNEMNETPDLAAYVGHIFRGPHKGIPFPANSIPLVKTHEYARDNYPAIYVCRDGKAACVSLWKFYDNYFSLEEIIDGQCKNFGTWSGHLQSWRPWDRPDTLLLHYEDMIFDLPHVLTRISKFFNRDIQKTAIPDRNTIAALGGRIVRNNNDRQSILSGALLARFIDMNGDMLIKMGYLV